MTEQTINEILPTCSLEGGLGTLCPLNSISVIQRNGKVSVKHLYS